MRLKPQHRRGSASSLDCPGSEKKQWGSVSGPVIQRNSNELPRGSAPAAWRHSLAFVSTASAEAVVVDDVTVAAIPV